MKLDKELVHVLGLIAVKSKEPRSIKSGCTLMEMGLTQENPDYDTDKYWDVITEFGRETLDKYKEQQNG